MNNVKRVLLLSSVLWCGLAHAAGTLDEHRAADPQGAVEISNITGSVEIVAWNKAEVAVSGSYGSEVDRVDIVSSGARTTIRVIPLSTGHSDKGSAHLIVHVPAKSSIAATLVSADLKISGVQGDTKLQSINGDLSGDVGGDLRASSVSGDVRMTARDAKVTEVKSVSGDITVNGSGGEVEVTTVSGTVKATLGSISRGRFKSVSGDLLVLLGLAPGARLEGESVSGDVHFEFATAPADASVDVKTMSGDITNCFGPKPSESQHGSGSRLMFKEGSGATEMRVTTQSGDVQLCTKGGHKVS